MSFQFNIYRFLAHFLINEKNFDKLFISVKQYTMTIYHMSCTAQMGPPTNPWAVVDPQLRVYGVSGLRVIDASICKYLFLYFVNIIY